jgi:hypothetical protein
MPGQTALVANRLSQIIDGNWRETHRPPTQAAGGPSRRTRPVGGRHSPRADEAPP